MNGSSAGVLIAVIALDALALLALVVSLRLQVRFWRRLPETVAIHFGILGKPDTWGPKQVLATLPALVVLLSVGTLLVSLLSGPVAILLLLRVVLVEAAWLMAYMQWKAIQVGLGEAAGMGKGFIAIALLPIVTGLVMVLLAVRGAAG